MTRWLPKGRFFRSALFPLIVIVILVFIASQFLAGCGEDGDDGPGCVGEVTKTYTEYQPIPGSNLPGDTWYLISIKRDDGVYCSRRLKKQDWLAVREGDSYG